MGHGGGSGRAACAAGPLVGEARLPGLLALLVQTRDLYFFLHLTSLGWESYSSCGTDALDKTAHGGCPESLSRPSPKAGPTGGRAQGKKVGDGLSCGEGPSTSKVPILPPHSSEGD